MSRIRCEQAFLAARFEQLRQLLHQRWHLESKSTAIDLISGRNLKTGKL